MLAKLRLDQTKKYEQALATYEIAVMLIDFALGRKHYMRIGSEQGGILKWDDIIIEQDQSSQIHIQVKRQTSVDFGTCLDECIRNKYLQGGREGQKRDLSPLDETLKSLADWFEHIDITKINPKIKVIAQGSKILNSIGDSANFATLEIDASGEGKLIDSPLKPIPDMVFAHGTNVDANDDHGDPAEHPIPSPTPSSSPTPYHYPD